MIEVMSLSDPSNPDPAAGSDVQRGDGGVLDGEPEPSIRRPLHRPAQKVPDDVPVTHQDIDGLFFRFRFLPPDVAPESGLNPAPFLDEGVGLDRPPVFADRGLGFDGGAFPDQVAHLDSALKI